MIETKAHLPPSLLKNKIATPISVEALKPYLAGYDQQFKLYLIEGLTEGFSIGCVKERSALDLSIKNLKTAFEFPHIIDVKLKKEIGLGRIIGPYDSIPKEDNFRISPIGVIPKKLPGEFRMIQHLSFPYGASVNDCIPHKFSSVSYASIQEAIEFINVDATKTVFMAKVDVESAFRIIPVRPADRPFLGFRWRDKYYMDAVLPMGCASSCRIFEAVSTALHWIAINKLGASAVVHYLDDFLFLANSYEKCKKDLQSFIKFCSLVGVPLAANKTVGPSTEMEFLGITLDAVRREARLPLDKLKRCEAMSKFMNCTKVTLSELQSLIGILSFACSVILPGRAFIRRLIDLTIGIVKPYHRIRLTKQVKLDLAVWLKFLEEFNGKSFFLYGSSQTSNLLQLYTDASGNGGYGAVYNTEWFFGTWPKSWLKYNIMVLELYPIVAAVAVWGYKWKNKKICFFTDNEALVAVINKQSSRERHAMTLLRKLVLYCLKSNIYFIAKHVPGSNNVLADKLSRLQLAEFRQLAPWAEETPVMIPVEVSPEGFGQL